MAGSELASRVSKKPCSARPDDESGMLPGLCINGDHDLVRTEVELELGTRDHFARHESLPPAQCVVSHLVVLAGMTRPAQAGRKDVILVEDKAELLVAFGHLATREHPFVYHAHMMLTTIKAAGIGSAYPLPNS
jgi:hypothetical protein